MAGPFRLAVYAGWLAKGALAVDAAATLRLWREGASEDDSATLAELLEAASAAYAAKRASQ